MASMNSKASILNHAKVGRDCPQRGTAATEPREAFGVRRIPALCESSARLEAKAPEYGALQTLRALVCQSGFSLQRHSKFWFRLRRPEDRPTLPAVSDSILSISYLLAQQPNCEQLH